MEQALREQAAPQMQAVLAKAVEMALKGHAGMLKLLLELHVSKTTENDDHKSADDKITININQIKPPEVVISTIEGESKEITDNG